MYYISLCNLLYIFIYISILLSISSLYLSHRLLQNRICRAFSRWMCCRCVKYACPIRRRQRISDQEGTEHDSFISQHAYHIKKYIGIGRPPIRASDLVRKKFLPRNKVAETPGGPIKAYPVSRATSFLEALNRIGITEAQRGNEMMVFYASSVHIV